MVSLLVKEGNSIGVIDNFFKFQLYYNKGAAFSSFEGNFPFLMGMTAIATIVFIIMARWTDFSSKKFYSWGVYLMIGGMIGNFIDRVFNRDLGVVDFLSFTFFDWNFAVFNLADSFLVIGVICIIIDLIFFDGKREKARKKLEVTE
jgi:signal peptidase II